MLHADHQVQVHFMDKISRSSSTIPPPRPAILLLAVAATLCLLAMPALANAPSDIHMDYDKSTAQLTVTITHPVADPATHYIENIKINKNGLIVIDNDYKNQPASDTFSYTYPVTVSGGDTIRVTARCVLGGSSEGVFTMPTPFATAPPTIPQTTVPPAIPPSPPATQQSPIGLLPFIGAAAFLLMRKE